MRCLKHSLTHIHTLLYSSSLFLLLLPLLVFNPTIAQDDDTTTETIFKTVPNPITITSYITGPNGCLQLPTCIIVNGSLVFPTNTNTQTGSGTATTTAIATFTGQPDTGFVLYGNGDLRDHYMQFDDTNGRLVFAITGAYRLVQLEVNDGGSGLLQNALNLTELVFLRYNETIKTAYPAENAEILDTIQEVRHADQNDLLTDDFMGTWAWNTTDNQLGLERSGARWVFYVGLGSQQLRVKRQIPADTESYDVYAIPQNMQIPSNSSFKRLSLAAGVASDFPSSIFTEQPTGVSTGSTAGTSLQTTGTNTGGTGTNGSGTQTGTGTGGNGSGTGSGTGGGTGTRTRTGTGSRTGTGDNGSTGTITGTGTRTGTRTGTATRTGTGTGATGTGGTGSGGTGTGTETGTGTGTDTGTGGTGTGTGNTNTATGTGGGTGTGTNTGGTPVTAQIYNIITSNNLQQYCTELLSYFSPTWPTALTTYSAYSTSTSFIPEFTSTETTYTKTEEYASSTISVRGSISTDPVEKRRRGPATKIYKTIKGRYQRPRNVPDTPAQLSGYPADSISAACADAVTSPTAYIYQYTTLSTLSEFTTTIDSTQVDTKSDIFTTTTGDTATTTIPSVGNFKIVHSNLQDKSGTYYGWYINYVAEGIPVKVNAAAASDQEGVTELFYGAYDKPVVTWLLTTGFKAWVYFASIGGTGGNAPTSDSVLNYRLYNYYTYQAGNRAPLLVDYNVTSYVATPAGDPVTGGRFYICDTGDAYAAQGFYDLYFGPSDLSSKSDYSTYSCQDTGMDVIQGENYIVRINPLVLWRD
ncbi:hypothetical protein TWF718_007872 [Orbilia javanica]|uniref:Uncharacterized protein n=1 Tax=Orbilia javanica TaxID=47235 RepID=A0AAN8MRV2_9PEZI